MKRLLDLTFALCGLLMVSPLLLVCAWLIKRHDGGPAFYRQTRVGRHGKDFRIWKFRTMVTNADKIGPSLTSSHDPRITRIGRWLRKTKLDELPQLINVILGEMSLVGPRPEVRVYVNHYKPHELAVLSLTPGITDPASLEYFEEANLLDSSQDQDSVYINRIMPEKIRINLEYAARANFLTDIWIILRTILRVAASASRLRKHNTSNSATQTDNSNQLKKAS